MASGDTKTEALLNILGSGGDASEYRGCCNTKSQSYILDAIDRVQKVEDDVEEIKNNPDVVDIVATYADLQAYDTQHLTDRDIIRVLQDETHDGESTYYRYNKQSDTWTYIGESKQYDDFVGTDGTAAGEAGLVPAPATTDAGKFLKADGTWAEAAGGGGATGEAKKLTSADYNWNNAAGNATTEPFDTVALWLLPSGLYTGADGIYVRPNLNNRDNSNQRSYIVSADTLIALITQFSDSVTLGYGPIRVFRTLVATGAAQDSANSGVTLLNTSMLQQATGTSTTDVMSQYATSGMVYNDPSSRQQIKIGALSASSGSKSIAIGSEASTSNPQSIAIGSEAKANSAYSVAIGSHAISTRSGEVNVGSGNSTFGYNNTTYRVVGGVHDGQDAHDAATVGQALGETESYTIATSDWSALSASSPYTYQATVTATHTIGGSTIVELINDAPVTFATYGFAIGSVSGQSVTIYSIGQPSASVTLKVNYKG